MPDLFNVGSQSSGKTGIRRYRSALFADSILITSAPRWARLSEQKGPAHAQVISNTRKPSRGNPIDSDLIVCCRSGNNSMSSLCSPKSGAALTKEALPDDLKVAPLINSSPPNSPSSTFSKNSLNRRCSLADIFSKSMTGATQIRCCCAA